MVLSVTLSEDAHLIVCFQLLSPRVLPIAEGDVSSFTEQCNPQRNCGGDVSEIILAFRCRSPRRLVGITTAVGNVWVETLSNGCSTHDLMYWRAE